MAPLARNAQGISISSPSRTVTSLGTSVNVAGGGRERRDQLKGGGLGQPEAEAVHLLLSGLGLPPLLSPATMRPSAGGASKVQGAAARRKQSPTTCCRLLRSGSCKVQGRLGRSTVARAAARQLSLSAGLLCLVGGPPKDSLSGRHSRGDPHLLLCPYPLPA